VIDDYLLAGDGLRCRLLIELAHIDLELRLKAGEAARVEEYLARYPELAADRPAALELISAEYHLRWRSEPHLSQDEYLRRFPQFRRELLVQIDKATLPGSAASDTPNQPAAPRAEAPPAVVGYEIAVKPRFARPNIGFWLGGVILGTRAPSSVSACPITTWSR
jgi:hypothetical protein